MKNIVFKYATIAGLISIVISLVTFAATGGDVDPNNPLNKLSWVSTISWLVCIFLAVKKVREYQNGAITYGEGLKAGTFVSLLIGLLMGLYSIIQFTMLDTDMIPKMKQLQEQQMEQIADEKDMSQEEMDAAMKYATMFTNPTILSVSAGIGTFVMGFIGSLVIAGILKREKPMFENKEQD